MIGNFTLLLISSGQEWQFSALLLMSSGQEWQLADLSLDLLTDLPPKCIMGYILWEVFHSHFGFFKKRWEFSVISE